MSKIMICGLNGCGKSTLGKVLANELNYLHKDIEEYYFNGDGDYKYDKPQDKASVVKNVEADFDKYDDIIFSSCKGDYGNVSDKLDLVIHINLDRETRMKRVKQRSFDLFGDRILPGGDLFEREHAFFDKIYHKDGNDIIRWFNDLGCNKLEVDGLKSTEENVRFILDYLGGLI